ncbi:MAG: SpoVG family protein [Oscillospiraceae bacterium]
MAAPPTPRAERYMPPASATESRPGGTAADFIGILRWEEHLPDWARESLQADPAGRSRRISRYDHPNHVSERSLITMATTKKKQQEATTPQVEARIDRLMDGDFKTKAFASATIGGAFAVHGIRVIESDKGRFISMPQDSYKKNGETKYNDTFHAITAEARNALVDAVNDAYEQKLQERQEQKGDAPDQTMSQQM